MGRLDFKQSTIGGINMKSLFYTLIALVLLMSAQIANAAVIVTSVTTSDFQEKFNYATSSPVSGQNVIAYDQIQAGDTGSIENTFERWEIEQGILSATDFGHTTWTIGGNYSVTSVVDGSANLNTTFNGVGAGDGVPLTGAFNEIWFEARISDAGFAAESLEITNQLFDGAGLPDMIVTGFTPGNPVSVVFKIHDTTRLGNIGESTYTAEVFTNLLASAAEEDWTFTKLYVLNPEIVPEPSTCSLLLIGTAFLILFRKSPCRKR